MDEFAEFDMVDEDTPNRWKIRKVKLADVEPMPENPRTISDRALAGLEASLERFGYVEPIVWNERTRHIVGGHQRFSILKGKGVDEVTMVVVNFDTDEEVAANLTLNNPKIEGAWDEMALPLVQQVEQADEQLFRSLNMDTLKESLEKGKSDGTGDDDDAPPGGIDVDDDEENGDDDDNTGPDTECPCCGHRWSVRAEDVSVEEL